MKKLFTLTAISIISMLVLVLAACGRGGAGASYTYTPTPPPQATPTPFPVPTPTPHDIPPETSEFAVNIAEVAREFLSTFAYIHSLDYDQVRTARGEHLDGHVGVELIIWANRPLADFSVLLISHDMLDDDIIFIPVESFGQVDMLAPTEAYVIYN